MILRFNYLWGSLYFFLEDVGEFNILTQNIIRFTNGPVN